MNCNLFFVTLSCVFVLNAAVSNIPLFNTARESYGKFSLELSATAGLAAPAQNVIVSPLLVQAALTLLYFGAADDTATLLKTSLHLERFANKQAASTDLAQLLSSTKASVGSEAKAASAFYAQEHLMFKFKHDFEQMAQQLNISTNVVNFDAKALDEVNYWFLTHTNFSIGAVLSEHVERVRSPFVLASAMVFQAPWALGFNVKETEKLPFYSDGRHHKAVDSMFLAHKFQYAELADLDATAIELSYKNSHVKMLILLPNKIEGLRALEEKLKYQDMSTITRQLSEHKLALTMPKFRAEFNGDLKDTLTYLGLGNIFNSNAKFNNMFSSFLNARSPFVTSVQHKAVLTVDETGGPSDEGFSLGGLFHRPTSVVINHPFYFAIRTDEAVLMAGHIVNV